MTTQAPYAIDLQSVSVHRSSRFVLRNISLAIPAGRFVALVGPNGAGKSTLLQAMAGLLPSHGLIQMLGHSLANQPPRWLAQQRAWLGQGEFVSGDLTVEQIVMLGRMPHRSLLSSVQLIDLQAVNDALSCLSLLNLRQRPFVALSGGEKQRVLMARCLAVQAPILLMDEPLVNIDVHAQAAWIAMVQSLVKQGTTVVCALHELPVALMADDVLVMNHGQLIAHGSADDALIHEHIESVFEHRIQIHRVNDHWVPVLNV